MTLFRRGHSWRIVAAIAVLGGLAFLGWRWLQAPELPPGLASGNGRVEAVEIDVAAKVPGRVKEILVNEGEFVTGDQILARMDTENLAAQRREAEAQLRRAVQGVQTARAQVALREADRGAALAVVAQRQAEHDVARKRVARSEKLVATNAIAAREFDEDHARALGAQAGIAAARAQVAAADAAIAAARSEVLGAHSAADAARATMERIEADIGDSALKAPREGRVQYRIAQPGEVIGAGGRVLSLIDLADVYMTFFLPTTAAGRLALGAEARLVLDAAPEYVIPASVSFVADVAQFTPKTVETAEERQKLMFRIKARIDPALLRKHLHQVKTGLPGMAYVRLDPQADWPPELQIRLPQ